MAGKDASKEQKVRVDSSEEEASGNAPDMWIPSSRDASLSGAITPGNPGRVFSGGDLNLHMGWNRFEQLILQLARSVLGIRGVQMRRYGVAGQTQHGIDLAGREPDNRYTVIQCKEYQDFTASDLREAVEKFASGIRPYDAYKFIVATSSSTQPTQVADELLALQDEYIKDLEIELWGAEEINDLLRNQGGIVSRFWTRETADDFCTGAPLSGVPAPPPDRQSQAEQILLGPLNTEDVIPVLRSAQAKAADAPEEAAALYGDLASRLESSGFRGHASAMRFKQLEVLRLADKVDDAAELAALLAVSAAGGGDRYEVRKLAALLKSLAEEADNNSTAQAATTHLHARLVDAAAEMCFRVTGTPEQLIEILKTPEAADLRYFSSIVLYVAEDLFATVPAQVASISDLIETAIAAVRMHPPAPAELDLLVRLRLMKAEYDNSERLLLARESRLHKLPARESSMISAREARRNCLEGRLEEAQENWRDAVQNGIHCGLTETAAQWLYAIRALNVRYGPWTVNLDEEHRLAQALKTSGGGRLLDPVRDPREEAMSALAQDKPIEAVISARRWRTESAVTGAWASETEALEFAGDLYRDNREIEEAANLYKCAGVSKKLKDLALNAKDSRLPIGSLGEGPWWFLRAQTLIISAQEDLLDDDECLAYIDQLIGLFERSREAQFPDSPTHELGLQVTEALCSIVYRGTVHQGQRALDLLSSSVERPSGRYRNTDEAHSKMCLRLAQAHPEIQMQALTRLFDLAAVGAHDALELVVDDRVLQMLNAGSDKDEQRSGLSVNDATELRERVVQLVHDQHHAAVAALATLEPSHDLAVVQAEQARDRILHREDPEPTSSSFGTMLVADSYLVARCLNPADQLLCLRKLIGAANNPRENASNRQDALAAARNLVIDQTTDCKSEIFAESQAFVLGDRDGSHLDEWTGEPHPLSSIKISFGSGSLKGAGIRLAAACAESREQQSWVRDQAVALLASEDASDVRGAAVALNQLPNNAVSDVEANLLVSHENVNVRQLCSVLCMRQPERFKDASLLLCHDADQRVRKTLAQAAFAASNDESGAVRGILEKLARDSRTSVRRAATGLA